MRIYLYHLIIIFFSLNVFPQAPSIQWQKSLGGSNADILKSIKKTSDGGFIVAGYSKSINGDVTANQGDSDYWVAKLTSNGDIIWQNSFGGSGMDHARSVIQTSDGGFIIFGISISNDGDITNNKGGIDYWIVKLDANGILIWEKSFGGSSYDYGTEIQETNDGGFILCGYSNSNNGDVTGNHGNYDYWIVKLNILGEIVWQKSLGGSLIDQALSIKQTMDDGYIIAGATRSSNGDATFNNGSDDCWIVKLDSSGNLIWQKSFGGYGQDFAYDIIQTSDGGYVFVGYSSNISGDVTANHGNKDCWIVKLDSTGMLIWQNSFGGSMDDFATKIIQTQDGNYVMSAYSYSNNGDLNNNYGQEDFWVIKVSNSGNIIWQKSFGGSGLDQAYSVEQTSDAGFVVAGTSTSNDGDISGNHGSTDFCLIKLAPENLNIFEFEIKKTVVYPNPSSSFIKIVNENIGESFYFKIVDATGKIVQNGFSNFEKQINIENFKNGNYLIIIETEKGVSIREKFIKY